MSDPLRPILDRYPAPLRPIGPVESLGSAGGFSGSTLWRIPTNLGPLALKRWPGDGPCSGDLLTIHRWLAQARTLDFVPIPLAGLDGQTVQEAGGSLWDLSPWMPGSAVVDSPTSEVIRASFSGLARFHECLRGHSETGPSRDCSPV